MMEVFISCVVGVDDYFPGSNHLHHSVSPDLQVHVMFGVQCRSSCCIGYMALLPGHPLEGDTKSMFPYKSPNLLTNFRQVRLLGPPDPLQIVKHKLAVNP